MPLPDPSLEPAVRDPKKLRNTAFVLVGIMVLGGWLVLKAYEGWSVSQANDDRPAVIYRITPERDLRMLRQDGKTVDLVELRGKVIAVNVFSLRDPELAARSMAVMRRLAESRAANPDFHLVSLVIDPLPAEKLLATLTETATTHGMKLPQWWLGGNEPKTLHKFIKNRMWEDLPEQAAAPSRYPTAPKPFITSAPTEATATAADMAAVFAALKPRRMNS